jgi:hypothetical protein
MVQPAEKSPGDEAKSKSAADLIQSRWCGGSTMMWAPTFGVEPQHRWSIGQRLQVLVLSAAHNIVVTHNSTHCSRVVRSLVRSVRAASRMFQPNALRYPHPYITHTLFHSQFCHANNLLALINIHWFANNIPLRPAAAARLI